MRAGVVGLAVLVGVAVVPSVGMTEARFTDTEHASSSTFAAQTLAAPVITGCTVQSLSVIGIGLVFQSVTITWTSTLPPANVRLTATSGANTGTVPSANISASGPVGGVYTYSATLNQALLTSLVTNLLGSTTTLTATNFLPGTAWVSAGASRKLTIALLGLNATCTV
jgi:hypothetical protein